VDDIDRALLAELQRDAGQSYATLGAVVGLSAGSAHERVRKLRDAGVIRRTTIDVDPAAVDRGVLAFLLVEATAWMGDPPTAAAFSAIPQVLEAHVVAGSAALLVKVRAGGNEELQAILRRVFEIDGVSGTSTIVVLDTFFERPADPRRRDD
jgi:Lrp/AsnC family transcriptional regulator, leucine-responsive regulatory protein